MFNYSYFYGGPKDHSTFNFDSHFQFSYLYLSTATSQWCDVICSTWYIHGEKQTDAYQVLLQSSKFYPYRNPTILTQTTIYVLVWDSIWSKADICYVTKVKFTNLLKVNENRAWENIFFQNSPNLDSNAIYLHYCCHNGLDLRDLTNIQSPMTRSLPLKFNSYL